MCAPESYFKSILKYTGQVPSRYIPSNIVQSPLIRKSRAVVQGSTFVSFSNRSFFFYVLSFLFSVASAQFIYSRIPVSNLQSPISTQYSRYSKGRRVSQLVSCQDNKSNKYDPRQANDGIFLSIQVRLYQKRKRCQGFGAMLRLSSPLTRHAQLSSLHVD